MSSAAQVRSTDAIEAVNVALARFAERVQNALDGLDADIRRDDDWIDHDRPGHWRRQVREADDQLHQAKQDLERCLLMTTADGQRPACGEQKDAVEKGKARVAYCREKAERVKKWQRTFRHDSMEFHGRVGQLRRVIEFDVPAARAVLDKILLQIELYKMERAPDAHALRAATADSSGSAAMPPGTESNTRTPAASPEAPAATQTANSPLPQAGPATQPPSMP